HLRGCPTPRSAWWPCGSPWGQGGRQTGPPCTQRRRQPSLSKRTPTSVSRAAGGIRQVGTCA
ncbi:unnamed protein product, partial [Symbiodinium sp. CCMP2456]